MGVSVSEMICFTDNPLGPARNSGFGLSRFLCRAVRSEASFGQDGRYCIPPERDPCFVSDNGDGSRNFAPELHSGAPWNWCKRGGLHSNCWQSDLILLRHQRPITEVDNEEPWDLHELWTQGNMNRETSAHMTESVVVLGETDQGKHNVCEKGSGYQ